MLRAAPPPPARSATLADVGRAAGVSPTAASAVLNHAREPWPILPATRERILAAAARLQYRPNLAARALAKAGARMNTLGVAAVVDRGELTGYFLEVFNGILAAAARHGQNTTVCTLDDWGRSAARLHAFCDGRIDGLILVAPTLGRAALPPRVPIVSIHANRALPGVTNIESAEEDGALLLVRHLIAQGHRRIMHVTGPGELLGTRRRIRGYRRALAEARIPFEPRWQVAGGYTAAAGCRALRTWLEQHRGEPLPHALFCANDGAAIGCIEALAEVGLRVPRDVSVAGFDDTFTARSVVPQLTSVRQQFGEMGARAVEMLLNRAAPSTAAAPSTVFAVDLVARASVGAPPTQDRIVPAAA